MQLVVNTAFEARRHSMIDSSMKLSSARERTVQGVPQCGASGAPLGQIVEVLRFQGEQLSV
eukprot:2493121-Amphidinium_carterae.2